MGQTYTMYTYTHMPYTYWDKINSNMSSLLKQRETITSQHTLYDGQEKEIERERERKREREKDREREREREKEGEREMSRISDNLQFLYPPPCFMIQPQCRQSSSSTCADPVDNIGCLNPPGGVVRLRLGSVLVDTIPVAALGFS